MILTCDIDKIPVVPDNKGMNIQYVRRSRKRARVISSDDRFCLHQYMCNGLTLRAIANELGVTHQAVHTRLKKFDSLDTEIRRNPEAARAWLASNAPQVDTLCALTAQSDGLSADGAITHSVTYRDGQSVRWKEKDAPQ